MAIEIVYGIGGFDPTKPNNNIIEEIEIPDVIDVTETARQSALEKLNKLGLTEQEIRSLLA